MRKDLSKGPTHAQEEKRLLHNGCSTTVEYFIARTPLSSAVNQCGLEKYRWAFRRRVAMP